MTFHTSLKTMNCDLWGWVTKGPWLLLATLLGQVHLEPGPWYKKSSCPEATVLKSPCGEIILLGKSILRSPRWDLLVPSCLGLPRPATRHMNGVEFKKTGAQPLCNFVGPKSSSLGSISPHTVKDNTCSLVLCRPVRNDLAVRQALREVAFQDY